MCHEVHVRVPAEPVISQAPSPPVVAVVQHEHPPPSAPLALAAFVTPVRGAGAVVGWRLTEDVVAFGPPAVIDQFSVWRTTWERSFVLDPAASICRLAEVAVELTGGAVAAPLTDLVVSGFETVVAPPGLAPLVATLANTADAVRARGATGFGVIDATPGTERVGLIAAWSPRAVAERLAADEHLTVWLTSSGLRAEPADGDPVDRITEVAVFSDTVRVSHHGGLLELPGTHARPLVWLASGATQWRVRSVPEVVVWARTLAGVEQAARYAGALGLPVRFTASV